MAFCVDDVWADVLHYYGRDIWEMDGPAAMKLAYRLTDIVEVDNQVEPAHYRSSVMTVFRAWDVEAEERAVEEAEPVDLVELHQVDPAGDVEFITIATESGEEAS